MLYSTKSSGLGQGANRLIAELQSALVPKMLAGAAANTLIPVAGIDMRATILSIFKFAGGAAPVDVTSGFSVVDGRASGTLTFNGVVAGDTITVNGIVFTATTYTETPSSGPVGPRKFIVGASNTATAANFARAMSQYGGPVTAAANAAVVTLTARATGTSGNSITIVGGSHVTASGSTLAGGSATVGIKSATDTSGSTLIAHIASKS